MMAVRADITSEDGVDLLALKEAVSVDQCAASAENNCLRLLDVASDGYLSREEALLAATAYAQLATALWLRKIFHKME